MNWFGVYEYIGDYDFWLMCLVREDVMTMHAISVFVFAVHMHRLASPVAPY